MMNYLLGAVVELVFGVVFVGTGRVILAIVTLGRWRGASMFDHEEGIYGGAGALSYVRDGRRIVTTTGQGLLGFVFYALLVVVLVASASRP